MEQALVQLVLGLADKYPLAVSIFVVIGVLRSIFKPLVAFLRLFADATPSIKDNALLDKLEASKVYQAFAFVLDYAASVKLPGYDLKK